MRATRRSSTDAPGSSTFSVTNQAVARSNSTLGRSVPVPAKGVEPAGQTEAGTAVRELAVAEPSADLAGVLPLGAALAIPVQAERIDDAELAREVDRDAGRRVDRVLEKGAEEPHRTELDSVSQPHGVRAFGSREIAIGIVEMEMACELVGGGLTRVPAIAPFLLGRQERDRHVFSGRGVWPRGASDGPRRRRTRRAC